MSLRAGVLKDNLWELGCLHILLNLYKSKSYSIFLLFFIINREGTWYSENWGGDLDSNAYMNIELTG